MAEFRCSKRATLTSSATESLWCIKGTGRPFRCVDGTIHNLPWSLAETVGIDKDVWEKLNHGKPAYVVGLIAEWDRILSSQCLHQEQTSAHNEIGRRVARRLLLLNGVNLLLAGVMLYYAYFIDCRPRSIVTYVIPAETEWHISLLSLKIGERYEHDKRGPGEFRFKLDFENLPALKELVGVQKWMDMQECSDHIRVLGDLNDIICSSSQSQTSSSASTEC